MKVIQPLSFTSYLLLIEMPALSKMKKEKEYLGCLVRSDTKEVIFKLLKVIRLGRYSFVSPLTIRWG